MKICFWGEAGSALKGKTIGGSELQIALLATSLAMDGHEVVVIDPFSNESFVTDEGVRVIHVPEWNKGLPILRLLTHRIPALYKLLVKQKADYYYVRMRSYFHLLSYRAAKKNGAGFIIGVASDLDLWSFWKRFREYRTNFNLWKFLIEKLPNDVVFNYLLRKADYITLQHKGQKIRSRVKGEVGIFPNIFDFSKLPVIENPANDYFVKVGTFSVLKGSENFFQLVDITNHESKFVLIGSAREKKSRSSDIYLELKKKQNLEMTGRLDHYETLKYIGNARAVISTSEHEGFPNIFLEAWAQGVPVISLNVNPGNVITEHNLGICCEGDLQRMKECIDNNEVNEFERSRLISYVRMFHDFKTAGKRFTVFLKGSFKLLVFTPLMFISSLLQKIYHTLVMKAELSIEVSSCCAMAGV